MAKNQAKAKQHPRLNFCYLKGIWFLHSRYELKVIGHILKNVQSGKCVCFNEIISLIRMEMKMKIKKLSHRYDIKIDLGLDMDTNIVNIKCT